MPRYYFHVEDDRTEIDQTGLELPDLKAAHDEAISAAGEILRNGAAKSPLERQTLAHVGDAIAVRSGKATLRYSVFCGRTIDSGAALVLNARLFCSFLPQALT